jgi:predicted secreted hydrolase
MKRRQFLITPLAIAATAAPADADYARVVAGTALVFPRDHGSHPAFRTEWWYITGWLRTPDGKEVGVQVTFFRSRPGVAESLNSAFAPTQLLFAHAALADPERRRLRHDQRAARSGFGLAEADETTTAVHIDDWSLRLEADVYYADISGRDFVLKLALRSTQALLLQGDAGGCSRNSPVRGVVPCG